MHKQLYCECGIDKVFIGFLYCHVGRFIQFVFFIWDNEYHKNVPQINYLVLAVCFLTNLTTINGIKFKFS